MRRLLSARRVLVGPRGEVIDNGAVLVDGPVIVAVGTRAELQSAVPDIAHVHRPEGTLLPGLIDAHVHLAFVPGQDLAAAIEDVDHETLHHRMVDHAKQLMSCGVTTARDLGDCRGQTVALRDAIAAGTLAGPRLLVSGAPLTLPGGHCWFLGGEVDTDPASLRAAVHERATRGVDVVKVMASGGQSTRGSASMWERQFDEAALRVIVEEAARHGLPVAAHAHGPDSIADAVAAGVATVEHCSWMTGFGRSDFRTDVVDAMAATSTVACSGSAARSAALIEKVGLARVRELFGRMQRMADHGVPILIGTDAGLGPFDDFPGAVARWAQWGFDAPTMIETVTSTAAELLGLGHLTGRLAPGLAADILLVHGDPTADLTALNNIDLVLARGR